MKRILAIGIITILFVSVGYAAPGGTISGTIKGPDGAPFRAAFVRAQNVKTKMTMMVLSDTHGRYSTDKLPPGTYEVWATALGFKSDPARLPNVTVADDKTASAGFTMQKSVIQWNQLTKYQTAMTLPEGKGKAELIHECFNCHAFGKIGAVGRHDQDGWKQLIDVMREVKVANIKPNVEELVSQYLSNNFGPDSTTPQSPAQMPGFEKVKQDRDYFSDDALKIEYVDYQLTGDPRDRPNDGLEDKDGNIWLPLAGGVGRLNPATAELKTWRLPDQSMPAIHEVMLTPDSVWLTVQPQNGVARFDLRTKEFDPVYLDKALNTKFDTMRPAQVEDDVPFPDIQSSFERGTRSPRSLTAVIDHEGNIWVSGSPLKKLDMKTKKFTFFAEAPDAYGIDLDQQGNVWFCEFNARDYQEIGMVDVKTDKITKFKPPAGVTPRKLKVDSQGMVWVGDYFGGNLVRLDPETKSFTLFKLPGPSPTPYGLGIDHNNNIWYASMYTDAIGRLDPKTGKVTEYPSPYGERATRDLFEDPEGRMWYGAQPYFKLGYMRIREESGKPVGK